MASPKRHLRVRYFRGLAGAAALAVLQAAGSGDARAAGYDWPQFNGDARHSGDNTHETQLSSTNVAQLSRRFQVTLPAAADSGPVVLAGVATAGGTRDLLFITTKAGHILALDAATGATVWSHQNGPGSCRINNGSSVCFTTSTPAIDPTRSRVFSYGLEGKVHQYAVADGNEVTTGGWPQLVSNKPFNEKVSGALAVATAANGTSYLYVGTGGYPGDNGDYQGHVTVIRLSDGVQRVFNAVCSNQTVHFAQAPATPDCASVQSAVWARAGVVYDSDVDKVFFGTGNGDYQPANHHWGDSIAKVNPDGTGNANGDPLDVYTPASFANLDSADLDLGSTAPAILAVPASSNIRHLGLQGGKDGLLRLINLDNLSGQGGPGHTGGEVGGAFAVPQGGLVLTAPATWSNPADGSSWVFVGNNSGVAALRLAVDGAGNPSLTTVWKKTGIPSTSPLVANGVLYVASGSQVLALAPTTGAQLATVSSGSIHWQSPVIANGTLYITDDDQSLTAYAAPSPLPSAVPGSSGFATLALAVGLGLVGARHLSRGARRLAAGLRRAGATRGCGRFAS